MSKPKRIIVLLDLNSTLAVKTGLNTYNWTYDVSKDEYSGALVTELMANNLEVHLVTARGEMYKKDTLAKIAEETNLIIDKAVFKPDHLKFKPVHEFKGEYLQSLLNSGESIDNIIAVESNDATHKVYKSLGLTKVWKRDDFLRLCNNGAIRLFDHSEI